jgi:hypothetical protein
MSLILGRREYCKLKLKKEKFRRQKFNEILKDIKMNDGIFKGIKNIFNGL